MNGLKYRHGPVPATRRRDGGRAGVAIGAAEAQQGGLKVGRDDVARVEYRVVGGADVRDVPRDVVRPVAFGAERRAHGAVPVVVDLRGLTNAVRAALEEHVLAEHVAGLAAGTKGVFSTGKLGGDLAAYVVAGEAQLRPQPCSRRPVPVDTRQSLGADPRPARR